jgi:hypothetical protein
LLTRRRSHGAHCHLLFVQLAKGHSLRVLHKVLLLRAFDLALERIPRGQGDVGSECLDQEVVTHQPGSLLVHELTRHEDQLLGLQWHPKATAFVSQGLHAEPPRAVCVCSVQCPCQSLQAALCGVCTVCFSFSNDHAAKRVVPRAQRVRGRSILWHCIVCTTKQRP